MAGQGRDLGGKMHVTQYLLDISSGVGDTVPTMPRDLNSTALSVRVHRRSKELKGEGKEKGIHSKTMLKEEMKFCQGCSILHFPLPT